MASEGASNNERLLAAAKDDNEDLLLDVFDDTDPFDINYKDGLGNTALHYAVLHTSFTVLEHILTYENCDVDPINSIDKVTPLHLAVATEDPEDREILVDSLLDAGADFTIRNKYGQTAQDLVKPDDQITQERFMQAEVDAEAEAMQARAQAGISRKDIASDDDDVVSDDSY